MKKLFITASMMLITAALSAQSRTGQYSQVTTDHFKDGQRTSQTRKFTTGELVVGDNLITVDVNGTKPQVYTIAHKEKEELEDEGQFSKSIILITLTKSGGLKALQAVLLMNPKHVITDVIIKRTKATRVAYSFKD